MACATVIDCLFCWRRCRCDRPVDRADCVHGGDMLGTSGGGQQPPGVLPIGIPRTNPEVSSMTVKLTGAPSGAVSWGDQTLPVVGRDLFCDARV
jgi:hypothetical protein